MSPYQEQLNINTSATSVHNYFKTAISVDCVIFGFEDNVIKVLLIKCDHPDFKGKWSLLGDLVRPDEDIDTACYRILNERTGLENVFLEQVHTFGAVSRHPAGRVITTAYYSLVNAGHYQLKTLANGLHWHPVHEIATLAFDHKNILDTCYHTLQKKIQEEPIVFNLLENKFSLRELQNLYEAILGVKLDRRNFRKKLFSAGLLVDTEEMESDVPHRPGKLYTFDQQKYDKLRRKYIGGFDL
jgi:8-oxo-dGTP diphosphatase